MSFEAWLDTNAQKDRDRTLAWFDTNYPEYSELFLDDFYATIKRIETNALLRREIRPRIRRESFRTFKYHMWYRVFEEARVAEIFALLHHRANPARLDKYL